VSPSPEHHLASLNNYHRNPKNCRFDLFIGGPKNFPPIPKVPAFTPGDVDKEFNLLHGPGLGLAHGELEIAVVQVLAGPEGALTTAACP
jgi:hypothetical protein